MNIFKVQAINRHRFSVDGKGITTLVGLYGCPLQCRYCINQDVLSSHRYQEMTPEKLADILMIDYCYFLSTGGGVTFGGGESLLYAGAIKKMKLLLPPRVCVNVETSLHVPEENLESVAESIDSLIIDIKTLNSGIYERYTGVPPERAYRNLEFLCKKGLQQKCRIRIPMIPDFTSEAEVQQTREAIEEMGFSDIDVFQYIRKDSAVGSDCIDCRFL